MTKNQLDNIIGFSFNFLNSAYTDLSPSYIFEKWNKYIGVSEFKNIDETSNLISKRSNEWTNIWGGYNEDNKEIVLNAVSIIYIIKDMRPMSLDNILDLFDKFIDLESVNKNLYTNLHRNLDELKNMWMSRDINQRTYKLSILDIV